MSEFLRTSEWTETRTFIRSFVKRITVKPGQAVIHYTIPMLQGSHPCRRRRTGGVPMLRSAEAIIGLHEFPGQIYRLICSDARPEWVHLVCTYR